MKAVLESARVASAHAEKVTAGDVRIGAVHVGRVALRDVHVDHPEGRIELRGVRVVLELATVLDLRVEVAGIVRTAHFAQDPLRLTLLHRDIGLPLPKRIRALHAGEISTTNVDARATTVKPEQPLDLGRLVARTIIASSVESADPERPATPRPLDPGIPGRPEEPAASVSRVTVERLRNHDFFAPPGQKPPPAEVTAGSVTIEEASLGSLPIAHLTMAGPAVARGELMPLRGEKVVIDGPVVEREWKDDDGALRGTLRIEASARLEVESAEVHLTAEVGVGAVELSDVRLPLALDDLRLSDLGLTNIEIPLVEIR